MEGEAARRSRRERRRITHLDALCETTWKGRHVPCPGVGARRWCRSRAWRRPVRILCKDVHLFGNLVELCYVKWGWGELCRCFGRGLAQRVVGGVAAGRRRVSCRRRARR